MEEIDRRNLAERLERNDPLALVEVLAPHEYERAHIPRAINIPLGEHFEDSLRKALPDKKQPIVLYCASDACDASPKAAERLEKMGYENVIDYPGGKKDWAEGGLRLVQSGEETPGKGDS